MTEYVDGYVLPVPKRKVKEYTKVAREAGKVWIKHGALQYLEAVGDDFVTVKKFGGLAFPKMTKAKSNETVIFAFVRYKSKKHRDAVNKKVMKEMESKPENANKDMPFELKKMAFAGFKSIVDLK